MGEILSSLACRRFISHHGTVNISASYYQTRVREKGNRLQLTNTPEGEYKLSDKSFKQSDNMLDYRWVPLGMMEACSHALVSLQPRFIGCFFFNNTTDLLLDLLRTKCHFETPRLTGELDKKISSQTRMTVND